MGPFQSLFRRRGLVERKSAEVALRLTWGAWVAAGVVAAVLFGALYYSDNLSPRAQARQAATSFWQAVVAGDETAVAHLLAQESPQTAAQLVAFFRGYTRAGEPGSLLVSDAAEASYSGLDPDKVFTFYDNGTYRQATLSQVAALVKVAASDAKALLSPDWYRSPVYAARYFTMNLLGIADWQHDVWSQTASGSGNAISGGAGENLGIYVGQLAPDDVNDKATVTLKTAQKAAFLIGLSRPWPGGPWLVVSVTPTKYVEGP